MAVKTIEALVKEGVSWLDNNEQVTFTLYDLVKTPEGLVFWVQSGQLPGSVFTQRTVKGSIHISQDQRQESLHSSTSSSALFTSYEQIDDMLFQYQNSMYIAIYKGMKIAFQGQGWYYDAATLWHYRGESIEYFLYNHVIDDISMLSDLPFLSNSTWFWMTAPVLMLFPSFLVSQNMQPPYGVFELETTEIQPIYSTDNMGSTWQLMKDKVTITTFGVDNNHAIDFRDQIHDYTIENDDIGITIGGIIKDAPNKTIQSEFNVSGVKKIITFEIDYYQNRMRDFLLFYITNAWATITTEN